MVDHVFMRRCSGEICSRTARIAGNWSGQTQTWTNFCKGTETTVFCQLRFITYPNVFTVVPAKVWMSLKLILHSSSLTLTLFCTAITRFLMGFFFAPARMARQMLQESSWFRSFKGGSRGSPAWRLSHEQFTSHAQPYEISLKIVSWCHIIWWSATRSCCNMQSSSATKEDEYLTKLVCCWSKPFCAKPRLFLLVNNFFLVNKIIFL